MRRPKYTDEDIIAKGKLLQAEGKEVTANAIKLLLGGGKAARIGEVWDAYLAAQDSKNPHESPLDKPIDPDSRFAFEVELPVKNAAREVQKVFETLLDKISHDAECKIEKLLAKEENRHRDAEATLSGHVEHAELQAKHKEDERYETFKKLLEAERKIELLEASNKSMLKQISELKERESS